VTIKRRLSFLPNEMFTVDQGTPLVRKVNTYDYTTWRDGIYQYNNENLGAILIRLSRYYGTKIEYNESVSVLKCSGKLELKEELSQVLNGNSKNSSNKMPFRE
jgi:ferric-dicitrate binding protein FerR (iron transport regulator)